jgi:hypothetical protein
MFIRPIQVPTKAAFRQNPQAEAANASSAISQQVGNLQAEEKRVPSTIKGNQLDWRKFKEKKGKHSFFGIYKQQIKADSSAIDMTV